MISFNIAMEKGPFTSNIYLLNMVIFNRELVVKDHTQMVALIWDHSINVETIIK